MAHQGAMTVQRVQILYLAALHLLAVVKVRTTQMAMVVTAVLVVVLLRMVLQAVLEHQGKDLAEVMDLQQELAVVVVVRVLLERQEAELRQAARDLLQPSIV